MDVVAKYRDYGIRLQRDLLLRYSPVALKLLYDEGEIPEGSMRPRRDGGGHLSMCQAYAVVRRERKAVTMLKEDFWCVWPLVGFGLVELDEDGIRTMGSKFILSDHEKGVEYLRDEYPRLVSDQRPIGFTLAPLEKTTFLPDLVCIYCRPTQLRSLMLAVRYETCELLQITMDAVDSCVHSSIPVLNGKPYTITVPDPGEFELALSDDDEMMFTVRGDRLEALVKALEHLSSSGVGYQQMVMSMRNDIPRPQFYNQMLRTWGLDTDPDWQG